MKLGRNRAGVPRRLPVVTKFVSAVTVVALGVVLLVGVAVSGVGQLRTTVSDVVGQDVATMQATADLSTTLATMERAILVRAASPTGLQIGGILDQVVVPKVSQQLAAVRLLTKGNATAARQLSLLESDFTTVLRLRQQAAAAGAGSGPKLIQDLSPVFNRMSEYTATLRAVGLSDAQAAGRSAEGTYRSVRLRLTVGAAIVLLTTLLVALLLAGDLIPRTRRYARFAKQVASEKPVERLRIRGNDELSDLGTALNQMVLHGETARVRELDRTEFVDTLQVTAGEEEAHELVQRHLERSLPGSTALVLTRNNSENRLIAATEVPAGTPIGDRLLGAEPRACLALRFGRTHQQIPGRKPLLSCGLCDDAPKLTTCEPLLVGGQVIGSVLVEHPTPLDPQQNLLIRQAVSQAAPVLANLHNLSLAEFRANNDSLTGLPNKRATDDTLKRMVAQANRSVTPLSAAMLDLDHFKQVNDRFGHGKGDEVLAAVGAAVRSCLRASDFAGRFGGEEILVLLPDTSAEGALVLAERIRSTVATVAVPGVERSITVSIGIADLIQHGGDASGLLRQADRALYAAKAAGRNRTMIADLTAGEPMPGSGPDDVPPPATVTPDPTVVLSPTVAPDPITSPRPIVSARPTEDSAAGGRPRSRPEQVDVRR